MSENQGVQEVTLRDFYCSDVSRCCRYDYLSERDWGIFADEAYQKIQAGAEKLFFWGHPLDQVLRSNLFSNLSRQIISVTGVDNFTNEIFNTLVMFALYNEPTSRIVTISGVFEGEQLTADWVEFQYDKVWWMADMSLAGSVVRACDMTGYAVIACDQIYGVGVIEHEVFWQPNITQRLNYLLRYEATSSFWSELCYSRCWDASSVATFSAVADLAESGQKPGYALVNPIQPNHNIIICQNFIDALM